MLTCFKCKFEIVALDDIGKQYPNGSVLCEACLARWAGDEHPTPRHIQEQVNEPEEELRNRSLGPDSRLSR